MNQNNESANFKLINQNEIALVECSVPKSYKKLHFGLKERLKQCLRRAKFNRKLFTNFDEVPNQNEYLFSIIKLLVKDPASVWKNGSWASCCSCFLNCIPFKQIF